MYDSFISTPALVWKLYARRDLRSWCHSGPYIYELSRRIAAMTNRSVGIVATSPAYRFSSVLSESSTIRSRSCSEGRPTKFFSTNSFAYNRTR